jgi:hypothetical protein
MNYRHGLSALTCLAAVLAAGCGGGGGGGGAAPSVTIDHSTVAVAATVTDATVSPATVTLKISNAPGSGLYVAGGASKNGISALSPGAYSASSADFQVYFKAPYTLAPATYSDTVVLEVCLDSGCTQQIAGSPVTVKVTYTVKPPAAGSEPAMTVTTNTIAVQALPAGTAPLAGFIVQLARAPGFPLTARLTPTSDTVISATIDPPGWNAPPQPGFDVDVALKPPGQLSPGVHTDHIKVEVCLDPACVNQLSGSPQTVTITYQVGNNVPGSYVVSQVSVLAADVVADDPRALLYVAVPAAASANASSVAIVDPVNATITAYVPVGFDPGRLALSDEGSYLYVAERNGPHIARLALPGMTLDATIVLPNDVHGQVTWPVDVKVQPGAPKTIAVGRDFKDDTQFQGDGIVIYDDTTARPNIAGLDSLGNPLIRVGYLAWGSSASTLYASAQSQIDLLSISASGAQVSASSDGNVFRIQYIGGLLYADSGSIFDPGSLANVGSLPANGDPGEFAVTADAAVAGVYQIATSGTGTTVYRYDAGTLAPHGTARILGVFVQSLIGTSFIRWGPNGLAFLATDQQAATNAPVNQLVLISGPFVTQ